MLRIAPRLMARRVIENTPHVGRDRTQLTDLSGQMRQEILTVRRVIHLRGAVEPEVSQFARTAWQIAAGGCGGICRDTGYPMVLQ